MKFLTFSVLLLVVFLGFSTAQVQRCHGRVWTASCFHRGNQGQGGRGCNGHYMWYYDRSARQCRSTWYNGCGGNSNRWCLRSDCLRVCRGW